MFNRKEKLRMKMEEKFLSNQKLFSVDEFKKSYLKNLSEYLEETNSKKIPTLEYIIKEIQNVSFSSLESFTFSVNKIASIYVYILEKFTKKDKKYIKEFEKFKKEFQIKNIKIYDGFVSETYFYCTTYLKNEFIIQNTKFCDLCKKNFCAFCFEECHNKKHGTNEFSKIHLEQLSICECGEECLLKNSSKFFFHY